MALRRQPAVLLVLDGWGVAPPTRGNAIHIAQTPVMDHLMTSYPTVTLRASGEAVGLPWGEVGNSEVGHLNIGAGKIIFQDLPRITKSIADGTFFQNETFLQAIAHVKKNRSQLHLLGLTSSGGVHSSIDHLLALIELCAQQRVVNVFIHAILDGRDTPHNSGVKFLSQLHDRVRELKTGAIATVGGRYFALDRDNHWDRIAKAYDAIVHGRSERTGTDPVALVAAAYQERIYDEELPPSVILNAQGTPVATVEPGDAVIFFNFRNDRPRQLTKAFVLPGFEKFDRGAYLRDLLFVTMTEYEQDLPVSIAFPPEHVGTPLAKVVADVGEHQLHIAETEKYAHVTYFLNGGREEPFPNEERVLIPSPPVASYDQKPEMSVRGITERMIRELGTGKFAFIAANFANADMVGHTGNLPATIKAVEAVDRSIGEIVEAVKSVGGILCITADHGNAEEKINVQTGFLSKEHSANPVPFIVMSETLDATRRERYRSRTADLSGMTPLGLLADVAPTLLALVGLPKPPDMTGQNLFPHL
ncbi:MAG: 2,3-bisphosphoglycerate-independent phosphoglycerate mutase [Candidatus Kerfeldbacteria bacterium]|nr:2,3-bisphosphoglycerate-independent phosphoglycerate mutase [Candidatus Kerfeldbacteria bacterium]